MNTAEFVKVASLRDVPVGLAKQVRAGDKNIVLCNLAGEIYAIDAICTHAGCSLGAGTLIDDVIECYCHGSRFEVKTGAVKTLPAVVPVKTYEVKVSGEEIWVKP